ncbi:MULTISPECIES: hypothetical protein [Leuconostoc]|jgi:uncharacterized membrane protein|uniref:Uncharacterized protein n=1 Tax=Leuconostoc citreum (strain KM20) TaxID=349519 RepID=B1MXT2_LEUCK|nr:MULTISPECIES: hypothetical protein [Leuconostoc]ACA82334.1 Hypothetical protein LCK_00501 [Leuconostoc citreum KM20]MBA5937340.1 hypothetical protein [Leuconostoc citreum]MBE4725904.1 hypothetical protein [Leuconostoc citreum]MBU7450536.1 hypothetical protein [Leuconostoc citreum]MCJ2166927.1 hypothetical protein [Leuconostoc citreum]
MKKSDLYMVIIAIILMFISLTSWVLNQSNLAILSANFGVVLLVVMMLWQHRES